MGEELLGFSPRELTLSALALAELALIIMAFVRGWIVSKFAVETMLSGYKALVEQANQRADDYKSLYETEKARSDKLEEIVDALAVVGEQQLKILKALPVPNSGDTPRVDT